MKKACKIVNYLEEAYREQLTHTKRMRKQLMQTRRNEI